MSRLTINISEGRSQTFAVSGHTLQEVLNEAAETYPDLVNYLLSPRPISIYVNDKQLTSLPEGFQTPVGPDDHIRIEVDEPEPLRELPPDSASLAITLASTDHTLEDAAALIDSVNNLAMAAIWGTLSQSELQDDTLLWAKDTLREVVEKSPQSAGRFFPELYYLRKGPVAWRPRSYNPFDPLDAGAQAGLNVFLRRVLLSTNRERYEQLFSFAKVRRLETHSPLVLEILAILGLGVTLPTILFYGCMRAVYHAERYEAETGIRQTERGLKEEELKQSKIRTEVQQHLAQTIKETQFSSGPQPVPDAVLAETARIAATSVADLGSNPLIGSVTLGLTKGK
jgi:hypothetical protein